jgi:ornithine cyclodeaminase/alanine dehydrogenase-like protein (mu-crystallin family)
VTGFASVPLISDDKVRSVIDLEAAVDALEKAYIDYGRERTLLSSPPAQLLHPAQAAMAAFKIKGARLPSLGVSGFRIIADRNTSLGEQTIDYCWVADSQTGHVRGLVDETWLHRLRTALTGVVAAKWIAKRPVRIVTILGAGKIADELPTALRKYLDPRELRVGARSMESARAFSKRHQDSGHITPYDNTQEAVKGADLVITISSADHPLLRARDLETGMAVCAMGSGPEIAADALQRADRVIIDDLEYAFTIGSVYGWLKSGLSREAIEQAIAADLGEIAVGTKHARENNDEIVIAVVQGMACCDLALANLVLSRCGIDA